MVEMQMQLLSPRIVPQPAPLDPAPTVADAGDDVITLNTGYRASVVPIAPSSKPLIVAAIARLSLESSRRRFLTPRVRLSDRELDALTAVDGVRHYAFGLCGRGTDGTREGIAAAHLVRLDGEPGTAEIALTVIDEFQGLGLGKTMLGRLAAAAIVRGIDRLRALIVPDNAPVLAMLRKYAPSARFTYDGTLYTADIPVSPLASALPAAAA
jgi:GNAT superfamily N-acetyltransferase